MTDERLPAWARGLGLQPHPEGGWFCETYRSDLTLDLASYDGARALGTAILFLLLPGEQSRWHRVRSDELWIHQRGGPLGLALGGAGDEPQTAEQSEYAVLGSAYDHGEVPQSLVPANTWQTARPLAAEPVLVSCVVVPGFDFRDFSLLEAAPTPWDD